MSSIRDANNTALPQGKEARMRHTARPPSMRLWRYPRAASTSGPRWHRLVEWLIHSMAFTAVAAVILIFVFVTREALPLLWQSSQPLLDLILPKTWKGYEEAVFVWQPVGKIAKYNILPLLVGTLKTTVMAMFISVPLALGSAIYVSQFARPRARAIIKPMIELLSGVPSVVLGFFALVVLADVFQSMFSFTYRLNGLVAATGLSLAIIPLVFTVSEDALSTVPKHLSEAALALGARRYQTVMRVILPAAVPGLAAALILGFGRAIGETMIVLMASGNAAVMDLFDLSSSVRTVTATIASELGEVSRGDMHWQVLFMLGAILFVMTSLLNWFGAWCVARLSLRLSGSKRR